MHDCDAENKRVAEDVRQLEAEKQRLATLAMLLQQKIDLQAAQLQRA